MKGDHLRDLTKLLARFPRDVIKENPSGGGSYVAHPVVEQRILDVLGPVTFELVEIVRGHVDAKPPNPNGNSAKAKAGSPALDNAVVGVVARMRAVIDSYPVTVEEAGDCEAPHNWPHDGARMKDAMSDAYKRCAMRLGVGLHLWAQDAFYLGEKLIKQDDERKGEAKPERLPLEPLAEGEDPL